MLKKKLLKKYKEEEAKKQISKRAPFDFPNRLWESLVLAAGISAETKWADLSKIQMKNLRLDSPALITANAQNIYQQVVVLRQMPMSNATRITEQERQALGRWFAAGAPGP